MYWNKLNSSNQLRNLDHWEKKAVLQNAIVCVRADIEENILLNFFLCHRYSLIKMMFSVILSKNFCLQWNSLSRGKTGRIIALFKGEKFWIRNFPPLTEQNHINSKAPEPFSIHTLDRRKKGFSNRNMFYPMNFSRSYMQRIIYINPATPIDEIFISNFVWKFVWVFHETLI